MKKVQLDMEDGRHAKIKALASKEYMSVVAYCQRAVDVYCQQASPPLKPIEECTTRKELLDHPDYDALEEAEQDILYNRLTN